jgi:hypothetical protein
MWDTLRVRGILARTKDGLQRMLVEIPLNDDERAAVEGDEQAVGRLIDLLAHVATPAGATSSELDQATRRPQRPPSETAVTDGSGEA